MATKTFKNPQVAALFKSYPEPIKKELLNLRELIFEVASEIPAVGKLEETLKWNQPSYLTLVTKSGSTIRIDRLPDNPNQYAMFFNCQTTLIETCKQMYPHEFSYEGNRAIIFEVGEKIPTSKIKACIRLALTYHLHKSENKRK